MEDSKLTKNQLFKKYLRLTRSKAEIKECFYHDKNSCEGPIKQSHSVQRNRRLSIIEGDVNGNKSIYSFLKTEPCEDSLFSDFKPIGKKEASTFFGFCSYHDTVLFSCIENFKFNNSIKHCFLHSYRAFAHTYHDAKQELKLLKNGYPKLPNEKNIFVTEDLIIQKENDFKSLDKWKKILDYSIENKKYDSLLYFKFKKKGLFPIACSSIINPSISYRGKILYNLTDLNTQLVDFMLTVLPDFKYTFSIIAGFKDDPKTEIFINELNHLKKIEKEKVISSLIISCTTNTFFSPTFYKALGISGRQQLLKELELNSYSHQLRDKKFFLSKLNFFDQKFSLK